MQHTTFGLGEILALSTALTWSLSVVYFRIAGIHIPPAPLTLFKNSVSVLCFFALAIWAGEAHFSNWSSSDWLWIGVSGFFGTLLADIFYFAALNRLGASLNAVVDCAYTPCVVGFAYLMFHDTIDLKEILGGTLVLSGIFMISRITSSPLNLHDSKDLSLGIVYGLLSQVTIVISVLVIRYLPHESSYFYYNAFRNLFPIPILIVWVALQHSKAGFRLAFHPKFIQKAIFPTLLGSVVSSYTWLLGFTYTSAARAGILNQTSSIFIVLLASVILKERLSRRQWVAIGLAILGAFVVVL